MPVTLGVRPEHLTLATAPFSLALKPTIVERLGIHTITYSPLPSGDNFIALFEGNPAIEENVEIAVGVDPRACHLFGPDGQAVPRRP